MKYELEVKSCMPAGVDAAKLYDPYDDPDLPQMVERYFDEKSELTIAIDESLAFDNNDTRLPPQIAAMQSKALRENP